MRALPRSIGPIHFVGIGGIGMSDIAEVLHNLGYRVQGSDLADSTNVRRLIDLGIPVAVGHEAENLGTAEVVVISSAVKPDNPEVIAARVEWVMEDRAVEGEGERAAPAERDDVAVIRHRRRGGIVAHLIHRAGAHQPRGASLRQRSGRALRRELEQLSRMKDSP